MPLLCFAAGCKNSRENKSLRFFSLPVHDTKLCKQWLTNIRPDHLNADDAYLRKQHVCSINFDDVGARSKRPHSLPRLASNSSVVLSGIKLHATTSSSESTLRNLFTCSLPLLQLPPFRSLVEPRSPIGPSPGAEPRSPIGPSPGTEPRASAELSTGAEPRSPIGPSPGTEPRSPIGPSPGTEPRASAELSPGAEPRSSIGPSPGTEPRVYVEISPGAFSLPRPLPSGSAQLEDHPLHVLPSSLFRLTDPEHKLEEDEILSFLRYCVCRDRPDLACVPPQLTSPLANVDDASIDEYLMRFVSPNWSTLYVPYNIQGLHWVLFVVDRATSCIQYLDTLQNAWAIEKDKKIVVNLVKRLQRLHGQPDSNFIMERVDDCPVQQSSFCCGAWVCRLALGHSEGVPFHTLDAPSALVRREVSQRLEASLNWLTSADVTLPPALQSVSRSVVTPVHHSHALQSVSHLSSSNPILRANQCPALRVIVPRNSKFSTTVDRLPLTGS